MTEAKHDDPYENHQAVVRWVHALIKERRLQVQGDTSHAGIRAAIKSYETVDRPRRYSSTPEDAYEQDCMQHFNADFGRLAEVDVEAVKRGDAIAVIRLQFQCHDCGEKMFMGVRGDTVDLACIKNPWAAQPERVPCETASVFDVEVDLPSGEVLIDDWPVGFNELLAAHPELDGHSSINNLKGIKERSRLYAARNIFHFFVGNTCPGVVLTPEGRLSLRPDEADEKGKKLATVCTDLWWATGIDVVTWQAEMTTLGWSAEDIEQALKAARKEKKVIKVPAGRYKFTYSSVEGALDDGMEARRVDGVLLPG